MIITISGLGGREVVVSCEQGGEKANEYRTRFGKGRVAKGNLFDVMEEIADFINNELEDECLFEVV